MTLSTTALQAITFTNLGQNPGHWSDPGNWSPNQVPGSGDEAVIGDGFNVYLDGNYTVGSLILAGAISNGNAHLTIESSFSWSAGEVYVPLTLQNGCSGLWTGSLYLAASILNYGDLTCSANVGMSYSNITNYGTFFTPGTHQINTVYAPDSLINHGLIEKPAVPAGTFSFGIEVINASNGQVKVDNGTLYPALDFQNYGVNTVLSGAILQCHQLQAHAGMTMTGAGKLLITGNGMTMLDSLTYTIAEIELNANGIYGPGALHIPNHFHWVHGALLAPLTIDAPNGVFDVDNGDFHVLDYILTNYGTMNCSSDVTFGGGTINNHGLLTVSNGHAFGTYVAPAIVNNYGTLKKPANDPQTFNLSVTVYNLAGGDIVVQDGELFIAGDFHNHADVHTFSGTTLRCHELLTYDGMSIQGAGTLIIIDNGVYAYNTTAQTIDIAETILQANGFSVTGELRFTHHFNWINGSLGSPVTMTSGSVMDITTGTNHGYGNNLTIEAGATLNISAISTFAGGTINNYGAINLSGANQISIYVGPAQVNNHGTIIKTAADAEIFTINGSIDNFSDGTIKVDNGELYLYGNFNNYGNINASSGAVLHTHQIQVYDGMTATGAGTLRSTGNGWVSNNISEIVFDIATVSWEGNSLTGNGPTTFNHTVNWIYSAVQSPVTIATTGILNILPSGGHGLYNTLTVNGNMNVDADLGSNDTINNNGAINFDVSANFNGGNLNNTGTIQNTSGSGDITIAMIVSNSGTINCTSDQLIFNYSLINSGAINVSSGATVSLTGYGTNSLETGSAITGAGIFTMSANLDINADLSIDIQTFNLSTGYGLGGTHNLTFSNTLNWSDGQVANTVIIAASGVLNLSTGSYSNSLLGTLINNGTVNCASDLSMNGNAVISNTATFHLTGDNTFGYPYYNFPTAQFNNSGTVDKTSTGTFLLGMFFNNQTGGSLHIQNGTMEVSKLDNAGTLSVDAGAILVIKNGTNLSGGTVTGSGTLKIQGNGWALSDNLVIDNLSLVIDANIGNAGNGALQVQGTATWMSGQISVPVTIEATGIFNISGTGYLNLLTPLTNAGTINCSYYFVTSADISNSGNFYLTDGGGFYAFGSQTFTNTGLFQMNNYPFGSYIGLQFVNNGTIDVETGTLFLQNGLTNNATLTTAGGATLDMSGDCNLNAGTILSGPGNITSEGTLTLNLNITFAGGAFTLSGDLLGPNTLAINTTMNWNGGNIQTDVTIASGATLNIGGSGGGGNSSKSGASNKSFYGQLLSAVLTNNGTTNHYNSYSMDGGTFTNSGLLNTFTTGIYNGGNGGTFTNTGTWAVQGQYDSYIDATNNGTISGSGTYLTFDPNLVNNGAVSPGNPIGELDFYHPYTNGSQLNIELHDNSGPGAGHDYVTSQETIQVGGNLIATETGSLLNGNYTIMHCNGGANCLTGTFASADIPSDYTISYTGNAVILTKGTQQASITPVDPTVCAGSSITLTASSADTYQWSTGETTQSIDITPYSNTTYTVTVTFSGVGAFASTTVTVNPQPYAYAYPSYASICIGEVVPVAVYANADTYLWSTGATTYNISVNPTISTDYTVTVTDNANGGCTNTATVSINVTDQTATTVAINDLPAAVCQNDGVIYLPYDEQGYYGYWSGPGVAYNQFDPSNLSGPQALTFTPYYGQCAAPGTWTITVGSAVYYADSDGDGYGDPNTSINSCTPPSGYVTDNTDCDDNDANVHPGATEICNGIDDNCNGLTDDADPGTTGQPTWYADADGDGYGNPSVYVLACNQPAGYVADNTDCDDTNPAVHPGATEICNSIDDNCNGLTDDADPGITGQPTWYADADGDGYGNPSVHVLACNQPAGYVANNTDCDDTNSAEHPGATETCNGIDDNCNGLTDDADPGVTGQPTWYADTDGDGYGNPSVYVLACNQPTGYVSNNTDCDDTNSDVHPGVSEICNGIDDNCNGLTDDADPGVTGQPTWYADSDGDGYGNPSVHVLACNQPAGYVSDNTDCDDTNSAVHPGATETCNGIDDNCNGLTDDADPGVTGQPTWYADADGDGYGNPNVTIHACNQPAGYVSNNTDCNDSNPAVHPGATEICNGIDDNCNGLTDDADPGITGQPIWYADADGDGYGNPNVIVHACIQPAGYVVNNTDCNDSNANVHPGATEVCNGIDDNCDGLVDDADPNNSGQPTWYADADGDGYGNPNVSVLACSQPQGYVRDNTDCDDTNPNVNPSETEICNGLDDDCNGLTDDADPGVTGQPTWYADTDGDGYGDPNVTVLACNQPAGYVSNNTDCNDSNPAVHPGATEICNGIDDNCNGLTDDADPGITGQPAWYADADGDGYGNPNVVIHACVQPAGYISDNTDCNDSNPAVHPGVTEICNGIDDDCDGLTDDADPGVTGQPTWYADADGDGYGNPNVIVHACNQPEGYVSDHTDCNDSNPNVHPDVTEICNGIDDNCNGLTDDADPGVTGQPTWYADADGDGYGDASNIIHACNQPEGYVSDNTDCDDDNPNVYPGATEICNGIDDNCNGLTDESGLSINLSAGNIACNGGTTTLVATAGGGSAPYQYSLDGGAYSTTNAFTVAAGAHSIQVKDANGCMVSGSVSISQPTAIVIAPVLVTNVGCNGGNTGAIDISVFNGTAPYTYHWSNSKTTQDIINLAPGTYTVTVTDHNGCTKSATGTVQPRLKLDLSKSNLTCNGSADGSATATASAGTAPYTYHWNTGATSPIISGLTAGTYTVTIADFTGCTRTGAVSISQPAAIGITGVVTAATCSGSASGAVNITLSQGVAPFTYNWSNGNTTEDISGLTAGTYTVTVTDHNGCTASKTFAVAQPTSLSVTLSVNNISCHGSEDGKLTATVTGGTKFPLTALCNGERYCFSWSNGGTAKVNSNLAAGTYTVTITDANGCFIVSSGTISEPAAIVIDPVIVTNVNCSGSNTGAIDITVSGGTGAYKYHWSNGKTTQDIQNIPAGTYTVTVSDVNGCAKTATATVNPGLTLTTIKTNVTCNGGSDGAATATASGGVSPYNYIWSTGATTTVISGLPAGNYTVTISDNVGCSRTGVVAISQPLAIGISGAITPVACNGSATGGINITTTNGVAPFIYNWNDGVHTEDRTGINAGTYTVTITDHNGCSATKSFIVTQPTALSLGIVTTNVNCNGQADGSITATGAGGTKYPTTSLCNGERYCYDWSNGAHTRVLTNLVPGTYAVTVTDANGCSITGSATVTQPAALVITGMQIDPVPNNKYKLTVSATGGTAPYQYKRTPGAASYQSSNVFNNVPAGTYQVFVRDNKLCETSITVSVPGTAGRPSAGTDNRTITEQIEILNDLSPNTVVVYPNPATDEVNIRISNPFQKAQLRIMDTQGKLIVEQEISPEATLLQLRAGAWKAGLYFIQLTIDGERTVQKLQVAGR
jgi:hypothetical protein